MGQKASHGVNRAMFDRRASTAAQGSEDEDESPMAFVDEDDYEQGDRVQRVRRHRSGSKPPWLRHRGPDDRLDI